MDVDEIREAIRNLSVADRRKIALFILDLEKQHIQGTIGPQLAEDLNAFSRVVQESVDKIKKHLNETLKR